MINMNVNSTASTTSSSSSSTNQSSSATNKVGPRAKCDQVVYEAIAKAAEIIVRGRCHIEDNNGNNASNKRHNDMNGSNGRRGLNNGSNHSNGGSGKSKAGTSVSRFHLEVEEVDLVR